MIVLAVAAGCGGAGDGQDTGTAAGDPVPGDTAPPPADDRSDEWEEACGGAPEDTACGVTSEELRDLNLRYADRLPFAGDLAEARAVAEEIRSELGALVAATPDPTEDQLRTALAGYESVQTSANPVRASGTGFAVWEGGGCVFGSVAAGQVTVEVGGPINDGGCLASYGH